MEAGAAASPELPGSYRGALAVPDFRRLAVALTVDAAGSWAYGVVLLVYVFDRTHSATWLAVTSVVRFLPGLFLSAYAGVIAERYERTRVLLTSSMSCFVVMMGLALLVAADGPVVLIVAISVLASALGTPYYPAVGAFVPQLVPERHLAAANAVQTTIENVATIAGPGIGALMLLAHDPSVAFAFNGLTFLFSAICVARITSRSTPSDVTEHGTSPFAQVAVGFRALRQIPAARVPVLLCVLATAVYGTDTVLFAPVSEHLHGGSGGYGYLLAAQAAGGVAAITIVNRLAARRTLAWSLGLGMAAYCLPTALIPALHHMGPGVAIQFVRGAGTLVVDVLALTAVQRAVPQHLLSRVLGIFESLLFAASALGALVMPPVLHAAGLTTTLLIVSAVAPGVALLGLPALRRIDKASAAEVSRLRPTMQLLASLDVFTGATVPGLERLAAAAESVSLPAHTVVVREGETADFFYVVVSGEVAVTSRGESQRTRLVRRLGPKGYFGEIGLLHGIPRTATVTTVGSTELLRIGADDFAAALSVASTGSSGLMTTAASRLARTHPNLARRSIPTQGVPA